MVLALVCVAASLSPLRQAKGQWLEPWVSNLITSDNALFIDEMDLEKGSDFLGYRDWYTPSCVASWGPVPLSITGGLLQVRLSGRVSAVEVLGRQHLLEPENLASLVALRLGEGSGDEPQEIGRATIALRYPSSKTVPILRNGVHAEVPAESSPIDVTLTTPLEQPGLVSISICVVAPGVSLKLEKMSLLALDFEDPIFDFVADLESLND